VWSYIYYWGSIEYVYDYLLFNYYLIFIKNNIYTHTHIKLKK